ncbi:hypothetical protein D3C75_687580 [compost metagenome]
MGCLLDAERRYDVHRNTVSLRNPGLLHIEFTRSSRNLPGVRAGADDPGEEMARHTALDRRTARSDLPADHSGPLRLAGDAGDAAGLHRLIAFEGQVEGTAPTGICSSGTVLDRTEASGCRGAGRTDGDTYLRAGRPLLQRTAQPLAEHAADGRIQSGWSGNRQRRAGNQDRQRRGTRGIRQYG